MHRKLLTQSENFRITYEFENLFLEFKKIHKVPVTIGWFYGQPECAMISVDEKYAVIGGCGLVIYFLQEPFKGLEIQPNPQIVEMFNQPNNHWEIEAIYQSGTDNIYNDDNNLNSDNFRFVRAEGEKVSVYRMNAITLEFEKISF